MAPHTNFLRQYLAGEFDDPPPVRLAHCASCGDERESDVGLVGFEALLGEDEDIFLCVACAQFPDPDERRDARLDR
jgi:hypothetical protein